MGAKLEKRGVDKTDRSCPVFRIVKHKEPNEIICQEKNNNNGREERLAGTGVQKKKKKKGSEKKCTGINIVVHFS